MHRVVLPKPADLDGAVLREELAAIGAPLVDSIGAIGISGEELILLLGGKPLPEKLQQIADVVAAHSPPSNEVRQLQQRQKLAKDALNGGDPTQRAARAGLRVLYASVVEMRQWMNDLRQQLLADGAPITVPILSVRTWEQALDAAQQQIDAEVVE